ncbi:hypothetical protein B296_00025252 [Ensete ventricosum]|uniref:Uncharacterized protein n=1 Tax=Ensete ventricosum TaxID=4639 RepID=A0A426X8E2_ENSVE|nr:hypothetical protein B296_00025252 [Ensete ventricosum]
MLSAWVAALVVGVVVLGRHLMGGRHHLAGRCQLARRCPCWRLLLLAVALAGSRRASSWAVDLCCLTAGDRLLWALPTLVGAAPAGASYARWRSWLLPVALAAGGCPCKGLWPWLANPASGLVVAGHPYGGPGIRMERMKEVKCPPLQRYSHNGAKLLQSDLATLAQREGGE